MLMKAPRFWWQAGHPLGLLLSPLGWIYGYFAGRRMQRASGARAGVPLVLVGNFTVGGTGKTPVAEALARAALARGLKPGFVLRGFGARVDGAMLVDPAQHTHDDVGDEAVMLSATAPVAVSPARLDAAHLLEAEGVDFIIMDDGLQSGRIAPDFALAVVDAARGLGNGRCLPAGPLRAPLDIQRLKVDLLVVNGSGGNRAVGAFADAHGLPVAAVRAVPAQGADRFRGRDVLAYAGIGDPRKLFDTLEEIGATVVKAVPLADHQPLTPELARSLLDDADGLALVTTAKDHARSAGATDPAIADLRAKSEILAIEIMFAEPDMPGRIVDATVAAFARRPGREKR
ncbi:tetraacyldisaccharide 4'-kinase [Martelella endophytica]|uniref:Tetraacyldisaccharide 4'-kinase n=1 Tax=Martelella endophytica TaxID=1486262 RepID=A0A0D5LU00_MAREN|nr:tetraacyldisaccharide 4'-kinase [Martelella endophytica]AJY47699.1 hypothetical protein TM49_21735 [Martelella endophytica]